MIRVRCPNCQKSLSAKPELAGRIVNCPGCKTKLKLPAAPKAEVPLVGAAAEGEIEEEATPSASERESPIDDADDFRDDEPRRRRRKRRRRRSESSGFKLMGMDAFVLGSTAAGVIGLVGLGLSFAFPPAIMLPMALGVLLSNVGYWWILILAFMDDTTQGLLCFCVPFYIIYYTISNFDDLRRPALLYGVGFALWLVSFCLTGAISGARGFRDGYRDATRGERPAAIIVASAERAQSTISLHCDGPVTPELT